jgi:putative RecB family exonuclease
VISKVPTPAKPRYGLTSDILGFRRCRRQYGFFGARGYIPAHTVQLFYGSIIHEVLDRAHHHYEGLYDPATKGTLPTEKDIGDYFEEVELVLRARGIRSVNQSLHDNALNVLKRFNRIEGPNLYKRVIDTEHRVQGDRESYIVEGVIDVLVDPETGSSDPDKVEIWDYKGTKRPHPSDEDMTSYTYQMLVYAALYKLRNGCYPGSAVLYFLNELDNDSIKSRPSNAVVRIDLEDREIRRALTEFDKTANEIIRCKDRNVWQPPSPLKLPDIKETCDACDVRWSCPSFQKVRSSKAKFS